MTRARTSAGPAVPRPDDGAASKVGLADAPPVIAAGAHDAHRYFREELPALLSAAGSVLREGVVVRFDLEGPGGGTFDLVGGAEGQVESRRMGGPHDCTVACHMRDWESCITGRMAAMRAYADGRLRISGDVGLLLRIQDVLGERAA